MKQENHCENIFDTLSGSNLSYSVSNDRSFHFQLHTRIYERVFERV